MAIIEIPTGALPYEAVEELPSVGEENKIYGVPLEGMEEYGVYTDYRWHNGDWEQVDLGAQVFGFLFADYQESVQETITEMQTTIDEQASLIQELEEAVFGVATTFQMSVTSLTTTMLNLVNESGEVVVPDALQTRKWSFEDITYEATVPKGTYYLRNDEYAIGVSGEMLPLVVDGTKVVDLGTVKVIAIGGK